MNTGVFTFNQNPVKTGNVLDLPVSQDAIEHTPTLRRASVRDAVVFGGPSVARILETCPLSDSRAYVLVDTKVTFLMPGWIPAIPGWHTDGVPRGDELTPSGTGKPSLSEQLRLSQQGCRPIYHTFVAGVPAIPKFMNNPLSMKLQHADDYELYTEISERVSDLVNAKYTTDSLFVDYVAGQWATWDWWNLHAAVPSTERGWRLLVRVTESDTPPNVRDFIRPQTQVYVPQNFGW